MKCTKCQSDIEQGMAFCGKCGTPVGGKKKGKKSKLKYACIFGVEALLIVLLIVLFVNKFSNKAEKTAKPAENNMSVSTGENTNDPVKSNEDDNIPKEYTETPFFALDGDTDVFYGEDSTESITYMTYSDFKQKYGSEILYESEIQDGIYPMFEVITNKANYRFVAFYNNIEEKGSFELSGITTKSEDFTFGRGIKVGQKTDEFDKIIPSTDISENWGRAGFSRYYFDGEPYVNADAGKCCFSAFEDESSVTLFLSYVKSDIICQIKIEHKNGVINTVDIDYF